MIFYQHINKYYYEEQIDLLIHKNDDCLIANLHKFCKKNKMYPHKFYLQSWLQKFGAELNYLHNR